MGKSGSSMINGLKIIPQTIGSIPGCMVVHFVGYIDSYNFKACWERIESIIQAGFIRLIFDCEKITYANCLSALFFATLKTVRPNGGCLIILKTTPSFREYYRTFGLDKFFNFASELDEAVAICESKPPNVFKCPNCGKKLSVFTWKSRRYRCSECRTILAINEAGQVQLG